MSHTKKIFGFIAATALVLTLVSCGSSSTTNAISANAASWNQQDKDDLTNGCLDWENGPSKVLCECFTTSISNVYSSSEFKVASEQMDKNGKPTQAYLDSWNNCDKKFGAAGDSVADGPSESQKQQASYPTCVQVLAPGNSGLSLADNDTELGRPDRQPGYCILPNSGGEKYYYQGRR
jgi:hypothetical protein